MTTSDDQQLVLGGPSRGGATKTPEGVYRDRWGRYVLPTSTDPDATWAAHTRATTLSSAVEDRFQLEAWKRRMLALGLGRRPDLVTAAASLTSGQGDKKRLNELTEKALEASGANAAAEQGTALHRLCERVDLGEDIPDGPWIPDVTAYVRSMRTAGLQILPEFVEVVLSAGRVPGLTTGTKERVAGTCDRIVVDADGQYAIADIKTGQTLDYSDVSIGVQFAVYASALTMYDKNAEELVYSLEVECVRQDVGYIIHVPAGQGRCDIYTIDLDRGWELARLAVEVRQTRKIKPQRRLAYRDVDADIEAATTVDELRAIGRDSMTDGTWTDDRRARAKTRAAEMTAPAGDSSTH